ncbi:DVU3141 family protein [Salinicola peritrichatus]|uniref:DVU3141 family protein n=1 Tax=Salinicola peritrichatus TaxID=1267424 RepID=UPI000DA1973C|nr:DVU3141 family protein [Salinicola peritrichatus]
MNHRNREHSACRHVRLATACVALAVALAGCAVPARQQLGDTASVAMNDATRVGPQLAAFLDNATTGSVATLASTPWGANVSVHARERYFAASGRQCVRLDVTRNVAPASLPSGEVACLVTGSGWYAQRLVTEIIR